MRRLRYAFLVACFVAIGACTGSAPQHDMSPGVDPDGRVSPTLPDGWRWESYRGVEVGAPADWGWGAGDQRLGQWCINEKHPKPIVGRPGASTLVGCTSDAVGPDPETLIKNTGWVVAFEDAVFADGAVNPVATGGDRTIVRLGNVVVVVQVPASLSSRVIATIHLVKVDHQGCPAADPASFHPQKRPVAATDVGALRGVTSVSVCKYAFATDHDPQARTGLLMSSLRYDGQPAARIVRQIAAAPKGGGPNSPQTCTKGFGSEIIVLRVSSSTGASTVRVRYSDCDHNGFDDGVTVRTLTRAPMQALIQGPNAVWSWEGVLNPILGRKG